MRNGPTTPTTSPGITEGFATLFAAAQNLASAMVAASVKRGHRDIPADVIQREALAIADRLTAAMKRPFELQEAVNPHGRVCPGDAWAVAAVALSRELSQMADECERGTARGPCLCGEEI